MNLGKTDTCVDVQHKKRGRPRLRDREAAAAAAAAAAASSGANLSVSGNPEIDPRMSSGLPIQRMRGSISSASSNSTMRQSPRSEPTTFFSPSAEIGISKGPSSMSSMNQRGRSISSNASLWSQQAAHPQPPPSVISGSGDYSTDTPPTVSLILSTGLQCARCSVESHALLGYSPSDLMETSLFELVHPSETQRLEQLWLSLIEPVGIKPQVVPANAETVMNLSPAVLMAPAPGTVFIQESMRLRRRSGIYDFYSIRLHLGGGFGADLYQSSTLDRAYIVASLLKLGNDATHSDPTILREARWHQGNDPRHFTTPPSKGSSGNGHNSTSSGTGTEYSSVQSHSGMQQQNQHQQHYKSDSSAPSRYDWQRRDENANRSTMKAAPRSSRPSPSPPPYSRNAFQADFHHQFDSGYHQKRKRERSPSSFLIKRENRNGPTSVHPVKKTTPSIPFSYSSRAESGGILC